MAMPIVRPLLVAASLAVAACASTPREATDPPPFLDYAGEDIDRIRFAYLSDWQALGRDHVVLSFDRNRHVLVELMEPCISDARHARAVALDQAIANTFRRLDGLRIGGRVCRIETMRRFDAEAWASRNSG
ncbi:MAG: DUF6491 family protein [Wenzhouxiangellaceae bacterium]|nr:DUF6491 family protein [Wenzhouxiangellaceae bacterium]